MLTATLRKPPSLLKAEFEVFQAFEKNFVMHFSRHLPDYIINANLKAFLEDFGGIDESGKLLYPESLWHKYRRGEVFRGVHFDDIVFRINEQENRQAKNWQLARQDYFERRLQLNRIRVYLWFASEFTCELSEYTRNFLANVLSNDSLITIARKLPPPQLGALRSSLSYVARDLKLLGTSAPKGQISIPNRFGEDSCNVYNKYIPRDTDLFYNRIFFAELMMTFGGGPDIVISDEEAVRISRTLRRLSRVALHHLQNKNSLGLDGSDIVRILIQRKSSRAFFDLSKIYVPLPVE